MSYQVIARKWRPTRFSDMVGQEHIARTLKNAIMSGRIAHAYLFVGPRGIGKTTTARIFAKALNCEHPIDGEPCCECESCRSIAEETNVDVIEIDAATHTQVDKARELCEDVYHLPLRSKYKVYIIDEVHMLSKSAWNALLKTIEEPPAHAKFIFATTEVNKLLPTVISRCQRFDLRRIQIPDIVRRLKYITDEEHVKISEAAISVIAHAADGGMRDAQSLLDQLIAFFGNEETGITEEQALSIFGLAAPEDMKKLVLAVIQNNRQHVIEAVHSFAMSGKNLEILLDDILAWLRGILLCSMMPDPEAVIEETKEKIQMYCEMSQIANPNLIQRLIENMTASAYTLRDAINKQVFLEALLLKAMRVSHAPQIADLIARLNQIRNDGELNALDSVVPIYEVPVSQIVTTQTSRFAPVFSSVKPDKTAVSPIHSTDVSDGGEKKVISESPFSVAESAIEPKSVETHLQDDKDDISSVQQTFSLDAIVDSAASEKIGTQNPVSAMESETSVLEAESDKISSSEIQADGMQNEENQETESAISSDSVSKNVGSLSAEEEKVQVNTDPLEVLDEVSEETAVEIPFSDADGENIPAKKKKSIPAESLNSAEGDPFAVWERLIIDVRDVLRKEMLASLMSSAHPLSFQNNLLLIAYDGDYEIPQANYVKQELVLLENRLQDLLSLSDVSIRITTRPNLITPEKKKKIFDLAQSRKQAEQEPVVQYALNLFGGRVADVHDPKENLE